MSCENKVSFFVARGYDYREVFVPCGRTDPQGRRARGGCCYVTRIENVE